MRAPRLELNDLASQTAASASDLDVQAVTLAAQAWVPQLAQAWMCLAYCDWRAAHYGWSPCV